MHRILAEKSVNITELRKNPSVTVFCQIYLVVMHSTTTRLPGH